MSKSRVSVAAAGPRRWLQRRVLAVAAVVAGFGSLLARRLPCCFKQHMVF